MEVAAEERRLTTIALSVACGARSYAARVALASRRRRPAKSLTTRQGAEGLDGGQGFRFSTLDRSSTYGVRDACALDSPFRIHREDLQWPLRTFSSRRSRSGDLKRF